MQFLRLCGFVRYVCGRFAQLPVSLLFPVGVCRLGGFTVGCACYYCGCYVVGFLVLGFSFGMIWCFIWCCVWLLLIEILLRFVLICLGGTFLVSRARFGLVWLLVLG